MSERRPHWDDQLVTAVIHALCTLTPSPHSIRDTAYAVIATVEDWELRDQPEGPPTRGTPLMSNDPEWLADARQTACDTASATRTAEVPVMDLRRLTEEVLKLNTRIRDLLGYVESVRQNLATHEQVLKQIGAYEATASDD